MPTKDRRVENRGPEARRIFTPQLIGNIILYMVAGGSVGGGIAYIAPTNAQLDLRVDQVHERTVSNKHNINQLKEAAKAQGLHFNDYVESHDREEELKEQVFNERIERVNDQLDRIEADIQEVKEILRGR